MYSYVVKLSLVVSVCLLSGLLSACGNRGALYLPDEQAATEEQQSELSITKE